ncbi:hypothetical protein GCM10009624_34170 [Gordonia sinesedis]
MGVPKISAERKQERSDQILDAARRCFLRKGFHKTSMADVIAESGLSAGAVYSYFSSKEELIASVARSVLLAYEDRLLDVGAADSPVDAATKFADTILHTLSPLSDHFRIVVTVWSEAVSNPDLNPIAVDIIGRLRAMFTAVLQRWADSGHDLPASPEGIAPVIISIFQGAILQSAILGDIDIDDYLATVRALLLAAGLG